MSKVLNFGSINVDHVYAVEHFVRPGETLTCSDYQRHAGGKGLNQSIALARAGAAVHHAGRLGRADAWLLELLTRSGVDTRHVEIGDEPTGHALIQVNEEGENAIVIAGGANRRLTETQIGLALASFGKNDHLLVQNETNAVATIIRAAKTKGLKVALNPAPMTEDVSAYPLESVDLLIVNETEAAALTGAADARHMLGKIGQAYPTTAVLLTLGAEGAWYADRNDSFHQPARRLRAVDTTGAGDTATGFFLAELIRTGDPRLALALAVDAATLAVTRRGAADAIPTRQEVETWRASPA